jgi:sugar/nucleoside kinase (ribokinase family)
VSLDVACGELGFVDLTFVGLDGLPGPGEERHATELRRSPGGGAITAIGCARLGLSTALASPIGADEAGDFLRSALGAEHVRWTGRKVAATAVTAVLPVDGERAMATVEPGEQTGAEELATGDPRAVVVSLSRLGIAPAGARVYATAGDVDARRGELPDGLAQARALIVNEREARLLTGLAEPVEAARALAAHAPCAVVTRGPDGAVASAGGEDARAPGVPAEAVDTTGAGDLFTAAYVWADLGGADLEERLGWAVLYASRSVGVATAVAGASSLQDLAEAGEGLGLALPARHAPVTRRKSR